MENIVVDRNGVNLEFIPTDIKRGAKKGEKYPAAVVDKNTIKIISDWLGIDTMVGLIRAEMNKRAQVWAEESVPETGPLEGIFQPDAFIDMARNFSARGEKMSDLEEQMEDITGQITELAGNMEDPTSMGKMQELAMELKALRSAYAAKKRAPREKKEATESLKVAA